MRKVKKPVFFIVFAVIALFTLSTIFGVHSQYGDIVKTYVHGVGDIRLGIDIQGGVDVTFEPAGDADATEEQMDAALETIKLRLANQNISDSETYLDYKSNRIIVRYPWQAGETDFNPEQAVKELGETAELTFRKGTDTSTDENGDTIPAGDIVLTGADVAQASTGGSKDDTTGEITWVVTLDLNDSGKEKFYEATSELYQSKGKISIWMDNTMISEPSVSAVISDGKASISGNFTYESAKELADKINSGALPFSLETTSFKTISPTMGEGALNAMVIAGLITLLLIVVYMIVLYRLLGVVASITLIGQVAGMLAAVSGWFGFMSSTTLTIPGIAGIILSVGMGVDANIITGERIREELRKGKTLDTALYSGYQCDLRRKPHRYSGFHRADGCIRCPQQHLGKDLQPYDLLVLRCDHRGRDLLLRLHTDDRSDHELHHGRICCKTDDHVALSLQVLPEQETLWRWYRCQSRLKKQKRQSILMLT